MTQPQPQQPPDYVVIHFIRGLAGSDNAYIKQIMQNQGIKEFHNITMEILLNGMSDLGWTYLESHYEFGIFIFTK